MRILDDFRKIKKSMWKTGTITEELYNRILHRVKCLYRRIKLAHPNDNIKNIGK